MSGANKPGGPRSLIGTTISDRYLIERLLGEGGMGAVYQAEHTLMRKRMAIKVLHPEMTRLPEVVARFEREAMAAAHIDHPHVVTATDFGKLEDGSFFLALEFVEGASLREVIGLGRLELGRSLHIARQMAGALQRAHTLKIVHRDLKPENVMLVDRDGDPDFVKVLDFGIAKVQMGELGTNDRAGPEQNVLTQAGMVYGTPEYMAPEQALGQPVDARADLYALGVIIYEMLTGHRPFEADSKVALLGMQVTAPVPAMIIKCPDCNVPLEVEVLVSRLLAKEASERIGDAKEVIEVITNLLSQLSSSGRIDAKFLAPARSGFATNPGLISGISPAPPDLAALAAAAKANRDGGAAETKSGGVEGLLGKRAFLVALFAGILGIIIMVTAVVYVFRGHEGVTGADASSGLVTTTADGGAVAADAPTDERVKEAIAMIDRGDYGSGIKRLEELGDAVEGREDVHRALFTAYSATDRTKDAVREAGLVFKANPNLDARSEVKLRVEVRDAALKEPRENAKDATAKALADEAFAVLEGQMGTVGWDDIYDIGYGTSGAQYPAAAGRARKLLTRGERSKMSPALQIALDLQSAGATCAAKNHFERAQSVGDERALYLLKQLSTMHQMKQSGFKRIDLLGCLHDGQLARTIAALEERLRQQKKK
jgi:tRNA A-37 threonylcarbamoyl transferase component Bud32